MRKSFFGAGSIVLLVLASACNNGGGDDGEGGSTGSSGGAGPTTGTSTSSADGGGGSGSTTSTSSSDGGGGTGQGGDGQGGDGAGTSVGWTRLTLLEGEESFHDEDSISAIHFASLDEGYVGTRGPDGSALYKATATAITDFAVPELTLTDPPGALGDYSVRSITPTSLGVTVALDTSGALLTSDDGFATFDLFDSGIDYGIAPLEGLYERGGSWFAFIGSGVVATSTEAPAPSTDWTERWAPDGIPTTPSPFPEDGCAYGPRTRITENLNQIASVTPNGETAIYVTRSEEVDGEHIVCVSNDGGLFFEPRVLDVGDEASAVGPTAAIMISDTVGFVATSDFSSGAGGTASIWKTEDAGATWSPTTLPDDLGGPVVQIASVFFAPGGEVGYAVGQIGAGDGPLLLKTTDGGDTWSIPGGVDALADQLEAAGTFGRLYTGFALDEDHIWVGGDRAGLFHSDNGAEQ